MQLFKPGSKATLKTNTLHDRIYIYALTLKKNGSAHKYVDKSEYLEVLQSIYRKLSCTQEVYEIDSKNTLHYHGIFHSFSKVDYKSLMQKGFHIYLRMLKNPTDIYKWRNYLRKTKTENPDEIFITNYSNHHNMFRDTQCSTISPKLVGGPCVKQESEAQS